jgi:hypothetical protein
MFTADQSLLPINAGVALLAKDRHRNLDGVALRVLGSSLLRLSA